jgi:hypothetical protein
MEISLRGVGPCVVCHEAVIRSPSFMCDMGFASVVVVAVTGVMINVYP